MWIRVTQYSDVRCEFRRGRSKYGLPGRHGTRARYWAAVDGGVCYLTAMLASDSGGDLAGCLEEKVRMAQDLLGEGEVGGLGGGKERPGTVDLHANFPFCNLFYFRACLWTGAVTVCRCVGTLGSVTRPCGRAYVRIFGLSGVFWDGERRVIE